MTLFDGPAWLVLSSAWATSDCIAEVRASAKAATRANACSAGRGFRPEIRNMVPLRVADSRVETTGICPLRLGAVPGRLIDGAIEVLISRK